MRWYTFKGHVFLMVVLVLYPMQHLWSYGDQAHKMQIQLHVLLLINQHIKIVTDSLKIVTDILKRCIAPISLQLSNAENIYNKDNVYSNKLPRLQ